MTLIRFNALPSEGEPESYDWLIDGDHYSEPVVDVELAPGTYTVSLTIERESVTDTATQQVVVEGDLDF